MTARGDLADEIGRWREAGQTPHFWLRDDDAVSATPALTRLFDLTSRYDLPLLLAVIPKPADDTLAAAVGEKPDVCVAVHGYLHADHAPDGQKKTELTENDQGRTVSTVCEEMKWGHEKLAGLFGTRLTGVLVPPWNRISPAVADAAPNVGFDAISAYGWGSHGPLKAINCHVDFMDWRNGRKGHPPDAMLAATAAALAEARVRDGAPIGLLTHHLVHDETAWTALETVISALVEEGAEPVDPASLT